MTYSSLTEASFEFIQVRVGAEGVVAEVSESEGWWIFKNTQKYTLDEGNVWSLRQNIRKHISEGHPGRHGPHNFSQLNHAFLAIREKKAQLGLPFAVSLDGAAAGADF